MSDPDRSSERFKGELADVDHGGGKRAQGMDPGKVWSEDVARSGGAAEAEA